MNKLFSGRLLLICSALIVLVALLIALIVIPAVTSESLSGATPEKAVWAFWLNIVLSLLSAATCAAIAIWSKGRSLISTIILVLLGLVVLALGLALTDAASAYRSHGQSMRTASTFLFVFAAVDILVGAFILAAAFLRPRWT
jgi:hypothetical protein